MSTHDLDIGNQSGSAVRQDLNNALSALARHQSFGSHVPADNSFPYQFQVITGTDPEKLYMRDATSDSTWHEIGDVGVANLGLAKLASPTFTGVVEIANGTNGAPAITFDSDTDTGIYRSASNVLGISANGTACHLFKSTASEPQVPIRVQNGTAAAPSYSFVTDTDTGFYYSAADTVAVSTGNELSCWFNNLGININQGNVLTLWDDDSSAWTAIKPHPTVEHNWTLRLPVNDGNPNMLLQTDGSGNTSWVNTLNLTSLEVSGTGGADNELKIGSASVANANSYIDFITETGNDPETNQPWDYNFRVIKAPSDNGDAKIVNKGTGTFYLEAADANGKIDFLGYSPATVHAWVRWNATNQNSGSAPNVSSYNISSITIHGDGDYTVNFTNVAKNIGHVATDNANAVFSSNGPNISGHGHAECFISAIASTGVRVNVHAQGNSGQKANPSILCGTFFI